MMQRGPRMIRFLQPAWLLAAVPVLLLAGVYVWRTLHRRAYAMKFTNVDLLKTIAPKGLGWRRHVPAVAFILTLLVLSAALARPSVDTKQPLERATVMLAIDVSLSMESTDVAPTRIKAAQAAAREFVRDASDRLQRRSGRVREDRRRPGVADEGPDIHHAGDRRSATAGGYGDR